MLGDPQAFAFTMLFMASAGGGWMISLSSRYRQERRRISRLRSLSGRW